MTDDTKNLPARTEREYLPVTSNIPMFDTAKFEGMQRFARALSASTLLPPSIRGETKDECFSNLMFIADYAWTWQVPPLPVAQCASIVHGKLVFEGKLIDAVLSTQGIDLEFEWKGSPDDGDSYGIVVTGTEDGKTRTIEGTVGDWKTKQRDGELMPNWRGRSATAQLAYRGTREWCRLWKPSVILGVYADDEIDEAREIRDTRRRDAGPSRESQAVQIETGFSNEPVDDTYAKPAVDAEVIETPAEDPEPEPEPEPEKPKEKAPKPAKKPKSTEKPAESDSPDEGPETPETPAEPAEPAETKPADQNEGGPTMEVMANNLQGLGGLPALFEYVTNELPALKEWQDIKHALSRVSKTDDWRKAAETPGQHAINLVRIRTYEAANALEADIPKTYEDLTLFRCFLETGASHDAIHGAFRAVQLGEAWAEISEHSQQALTGAVHRKIGIDDE